MSSKSIWKGHFTFGLLSVPVSVHAASGSSDDIAFNQLHRACGHRTKQKNVCSTCHVDGVPVDLTSADIMKGYEFSKGQYVTITPEELAAVKVSSTHIIAVNAFTETAPPTALIDKTYFLVPNEEFGRKAYTVILKAMQATPGLQAVGTVQMFKKEYQVIITATDDGLQMQTLSDASQLRSMADISELSSLPDAGEAEVAMASQMINAYVKDVDYGAFVDTYKTSVKAMIAAKIAGEAYVATEAPKPSTASLLEALQASLTAINAQPVKVTTPKTGPTKVVKAPKRQKVAA